MFSAKGSAPFVVALAVAVSVVGPLTSSPDAQASAGVPQSGSTTLTPQIVQPGSRPTSADRAKTRGTISFTPVKKGRPVVLQRQLAGSTSWTNVTTLRQNGKGVVSFTGPAKSGTSWFSYRGVAKRYSGLPTVTSSSQSAAVWSRTFDDEFVGTVLSPKWHDRVSNASSRRCSSVGDPRARSVGGGTLSLMVKRDPAKIGQTCQTTVYGSSYRLNYYLNGQVSTDTLVAPFKQTYGTFAARIKFPKQRGKHGSLWMQPMQRLYGASPDQAGAEIDIVEFFGKGYVDGGLASFLYNYGILDGSGNPKKIGGIWPKATRMLPAGDAWWKNYHVFSLEWTPSRYIFRVDGREHFRTSTGVSGVDEYLILSLLSSDWELRDAQRLGLDPRGTMKVDWVRAWSQ